MLHHIHIFKAWLLKKYVLMKTINKHGPNLFITYIEVTFLILQHKIQHTDVSAIDFKTVNLL